MKIYNAKEGYKYCNKEKTFVFEGIAICDGGGSIDDYLLITDEEAKQIQEEQERLEKERIEALEKSRQE